MQVRWLGVALSRGRAGTAGCGGDDEGGVGAAPRSGTSTRGGDVEKFPADSTLGKIQRRARSRSASSSTCRRSASRTRRAGEVEGFDVEMGKAVAAKLGVKPKFIEAISDNRIPFLEDGTADLILSTMTINEERVEQIEFSDPYFIARGRVLVPGDSAITGVARPRQERLHRAGLDLRGEPQEAGARRPSSSSWTPTRSAWSSCRTARSTRSRPTT